MNDIILQAKGISKVFPGVTALEKVDFELAQGEVHALVGENGAGKSTLMHIFGGIHKPSDGVVELNGKPVSFGSVHDAITQGISVVFQELSLSEHMSVAENIFCNRQPVGKAGTIRFKELYRETRALLQWFDEDSIDPAQKVKSLSIAQKQIVEILKAISTHPRVLILDEPTASLSRVDTEKLFQNIRKLKKQGMSFIYISHHLNEIFEIADRLTVLRDGKKVVSGAVSDFSEKDLVRHMVGRQMNDEEIVHRDQSGQDTVLELRGLTLKPHFSNVSLQVKKGEIVCLSGLVGAGRSEVLKSAVGLMPNEGGQVLLDGQERHFASYRQAIDAGVVYLTENRKEEGLFLEMTLTDNMIAPSLPSFSKGLLRFVDNAKVSRFTRQCREEFHVVTPSLKQKVRNLSGGNQQKVLLSMWVSQHPRVLMIDEPTKGVDVGARSEIYAMLRKIADQGTAILVVSSDLMEVLNISDRVLVMREGTLVADLPRAQATQEKILSCELGFQS